MMSILRKILIPFALLYGLIISIRNYFYDINLLTSKAYPFPVIGVGNLSVGGTGKTPMIEYLLRLLMPEHRVATLSRGYGRNTSGFHLLDGTENASMVGDEPLQFKTKFPEASIAIDENRQRGISRLNAESSPEVILLDDAFQHRKVKPGLNILLTTYGNLYSNDFILPTGNLREPATGAGRAQIIVVTKCPKNIPVEEQEKIKNSLNIKDYQNLFFSYIGYNNKIYNEEKEVALKDVEGKKVCLVTGIANPKPLQKFLSNQNISFDHLKFPDHHNFAQKDLERIAKTPFVITTEKDYMRLKDLITHPALFYLPIKMKFLNNAQKFDNLVDGFVRNEK